MLLVRLLLFEKDRNPELLFFEPLVDVYLLRYIPAVAYWLILYSQMLSETGAIIFLNQRCQELTGAIWPLPRTPGMHH